MTFAACDNQDGALTFFGGKKRNERFGAIPELLEEEALMGDELGGKRSKEGCVEKRVRKRHGAFV